MACHRAGGTASGTGGRCVCRPLRRARSSRSSCGPPVRLGLPAMSPSRLGWRVCQSVRETADPVAPGYHPRLDVATGASPSTEQGACDGRRCPRTRRSRSSRSAGSASSSSSRRGPSPARRSTRPASGSCPTAAASRWRRRASTVDGDRLTIRFNVMVGPGLAAAGARPLDAATSRSSPRPTLAAAGPAAAPAPSRSSAARNAVTPRDRCGRAPPRSWTSRSTRPSGARPRRDGSSVRLRRGRLPRPGLGYLGWSVAAAGSGSCSRPV